MTGLFRILGAAVAVAAVGAAVVAVSKLLEKDDPIEVFETEFPEEPENAEDDPAVAAETAAAYAEATPPAPQAEAAQAEAAVKEEEPAAETETAAPEVKEEAPAEEAPEAPAQPEPQKAPAKKSRSKKAAAPAEEANVNPVEAGPAVAPKDENGKFDPTQIAAQEDFGDWEEQGCKG